MTTEKRYSAEILHQIWDDKTGDRIDVGSDRDGLDLLELRAYDCEGNLLSSFTATKPQMHLIAKALLTLAPDADEEYER